MGSWHINRIQRSFWVHYLLTHRNVFNCQRKRGLIYRLPSSGTGGIPTNLGRRPSSALRSINVFNSASQMPEPFANSLTPKPPAVLSSIAAKWHDLQTRPAAIEHYPFWVSGPTRVTLLAMISINIMPRMVRRKLVPVLTFDGTSPFEPE